MDGVKKGELEIEVEYDFENLVWLVLLIVDEFVVIVSLGKSLLCLLELLFIRLYCMVWIFVFCWNFRKVGRYLKGLGLNFDVVEVVSIFLMW